MPLYEYECEACGHRFETIQKFSDPPREKCPKCGGHVRKLQAAPAIQFKGSGWDITDYAKKGGGSASSEKSSDEKSSDEKSTDKSTKGDSSTKGEAPAAKSEASADKSEKSGTSTKGE